MKLENQLVCRELSEKIKSLGVKQDSLWYWVESPKSKVFTLLDFYLKKASYSYYQLEILEGRKCFSAFTVAELLNLRRMTVTIYGSTNNIADFLARELIKDLEVKND